MASHAVNAGRKTPSGCESFFGVSSVLPFSEGDASIAGELRAALEMGGTPIGPYDF